MHKHLIVIGLVACIAGCPPRESTGPEVSPDGQVEATPTPTPSPSPTTSSRVGFTGCMNGLPTDGMWKCDPIVADVNGDGHLDIGAIPRRGDGPHVWLGDGTGNWTDSSQGLAVEDRSCGGGLEFADINSDGHLDLVVADHCQGVFVYLGDGTGSWTMVTNAMYPKELSPDDPENRMYVGAEDIAVGDVNGDGNLDLLAASSDAGGLNLWLGDGTGSNWTWIVSGLPSSGWANRVVLVDLNGDDVLDVVATHSEGPRVWLGEGQGTWVEASDGLPSPLIKGLYVGVTVGDLNHDGRPDLALANWIDGPEVHLQQSDGSWLKSADVFTDMVGGALGIDVGDLDGDGEMDLVVAGRMQRNGGYVRGMFALMGDGAGGWLYMPDCGLPATGMASSPGVKLADINGNAMLDVIVTSGLIVETAPGRTEPILPERVLVWCSAPVGNE